MELVFSGTIIPLLNEHILKEYREVLGQPKFHRAEGITEDVLTEITQLRIYVDAEGIDMVLPDPKDRVFYEIVMEEWKSEDAYLVTRNIRRVCY